LNHKRVHARRLTRCGKTYPPLHALRGTGCVALAQSPSDADCRRLIEMGFAALNPSHRSSTQQTFYADTGGRRRRRSTAVSAVHSENSAQGTERTPFYSSLGISPIFGIILRPWLVL